MTRHKLQGISKDVISITSEQPGGFFKNWEYTVLSSVRMSEGLFMFQPFDIEKSFKASNELKA